MPKTKTLICGAALASSASRIWVQNSTTMTGAAISTAAAKNVTTSPVIVWANEPGVVLGRLVPTAWNDRMNPLHNDDGGARGEEQRREEEIVELPENRRLLLGERVDGLGKIDSREQIDQAPGRHHRGDEERDHEAQDHAHDGLDHDGGDDLRIGQGKGVVLQRPRRKEGDGRGEADLEHHRNR